MRKIIVPVLLASLITNQAFAYDENTTVSLGPLQVSMKYCEQVDKISGIVNSMTTVNWPVNGGAGITTGVLSNSSVILDFCDYMGRLKGLNLQDATNQTLDLLNKMTGNKWDDQLNFTRSTFDLKDIVLDSSGKKRPMAEMLTASNASKLNSWMKEGADLHDKSNPDDPINLRTRAQIESDMNRLNQMAYKKALLNDVSSCPTPNTSDEKLAGIYEKEIVPEQEEMAKEKEYIEFYSESLRQMGIKFADNDKSYNEFLKRLSQIENSALRYEITVRTKKVETTKRKAVKPPKDDPTAPRTQEYKEKIDRKYQTFAVVPNDQLIENFIKDYSNKWQTYTQAQVVQRTFGILDSPIRRVEDDFKDWSLLCNVGEIKAHYDREDPKYDRKVEEELATCKEKKNAEISTTGNLLKFYVYEMHKKNKEYKEGQAHIWTFESFHMGNFRTVDGKTDANGFAQEQVACTPISNLGALQDLALKQDALNLEINQMLVEQSMKQNKILEDQANAEKAQAEENERRRAIEIEVKRRNDQDYADKVSYPDIKRGL